MFEANKPVEFQEADFTDPGFQTLFGLVRDGICLVTDDEDRTIIHVLNDEELAQALRHEERRTNEA